MSAIASMSPRVWAGDKETVEEARPGYRAGTVSLLEWAMLLYSFRYVRKYRKQLCALHTRLSAMAWEVRICEPADDRERAQLVAKADVLSTYLGYIASQGNFLQPRRDELRTIAKLTARYGIKHASADAGLLTERLLLLLTVTDPDLMRLQERSGNEESLAQVAVLASQVPDRNQRVRVYRKLGLRLRQYRHLFSGVAWGIRACFVRGIPAAVRAKSVAALLAFE